MSDEERLRRLLGYARRVLTAYLARCRDNGYLPPPELESMALLLASDRPCPPELDGFDGTSNLLCVTYDSAAQALSVSRRTVERLVATGALPTVSIGASRRVVVTDLTAFVDGLLRRPAVNAPAASQQEDWRTGLHLRGVGAAGAPSEGAP